MDDFLRNPPLFLRGNHVVFKGVGPEKAGGNVHDFYLIPVTRTAARHRNTFLGIGTVKAGAGAFEIRYAGSSNLPDLSGAERFQAVWGGYEAGGKVECRLGAGGADIMLTPELTGCAIAWAAQPDGSARFSHYNLKQETRTLDAPGMVGAAREDYRGVGNVGVMTKEHYHGKARHNRAMMHANVVGWRNGGQWEFWIQYVENKQDVQQIRGVEKLRPGSRIG
jgi:hypothetical protein